MLEPASAFKVGSRVESNAYGKGTVTDNSTSANPYQILVKFDEDSGFLDTDHFYVTTFRLNRLEESA